MVPPADTATAPADRPATDTTPGAGRRSWAAPVLATALLGVLGAWGLGSRSFWIDEGISAGATNELVATWRNTGGTMALYYALLTPWSWVDLHRTWLRSLSLVLAMAAIPVVWAAVRRLFDRRVAGLAATFTAASWVVVRYAQEARSYSLVLLLTSLSWLALVAAFQSDDEAAARRWWRLYVAVTVLAPLAHGLAVLQFAVQAGWVALGPDRTARLHRFKPVFIALAAVMTMLVLGGANDVASWIPPLHLGQVHELAAAFTGPTAAGGLVLAAATFLGLAVCVQRIRTEADAERRWLAMAPIAWGLVPVAVLLVLSAVRPYFLARYVIACAPGIATLLALAVLGARPKVSLGRAAVVAVPVVVALAAGQVQLHDLPGDDWTTAVRTVAEGARSGDGVVFVDPAVRSAFDFAWDELPAADRATVPDAVSPVEPIGDLRRFYLIIDPAELADAVGDDDHRRLWLISEDGESLDDRTDELLADDAVADRYATVSDRTLAGGVRVVLLEER